MGFYIWGHGITKPFYLTLMGEPLDHDVCYTRAALDYLLRQFEKLMPAGKWAEVQKLMFVSDVGRHFRAYKFFSYWLDIVPRRIKKDTEEMHFAPCSWQMLHRWRRWSHSCLDSSDRCEVHS